MLFLIFSQDPLYKATVSVLIKMILIYSKLQSADLNLEMLGWLTWSNRNLEDTWLVYFLKNIFQGCVLYFRLVIHLSSVFGSSPIIRNMNLNLLYSLPSSKHPGLGVRQTSFQ